MFALTTNMQATRVDTTQRWLILRHTNATLKTASQVTLECDERLHTGRGGGSLQHVFNTTFLFVCFYHSDEQWYDHNVDIKYNAGEMFLSVNPQWDETNNPTYYLIIGVWAELTRFMIPWKKLHHATVQLLLSARWNWRASPKNCRMSRFQRWLSWGGRRCS